MRILITFLLFISISFSASFSNHNGDVKQVVLGKIKSFETAPIVKVYGNRVPVLKGKSSYYALIPIPVRYGEKSVSYIVENGEKRVEKSFKVRKKKYKTSHVKLKSNKRVVISAEDLERIKKERVFVVDAKEYFDENNSKSLNFTFPLTEKPWLSTPYGYSRIFNGKKRNPHGGWDLAIPTGTPIVAAESGKVTLARELFFSGNTVFINHIQNISTMYGHLSRIKVKDGDMVKKGDIIGYVGATGRASGPHLHFSLVIAGVYVNPRTFYGDVNKYVKH